MKVNKEYMDGYERDFYNVYKVSLSVVVALLAVLAVFGN